MGTAGLADSNICRLCGFESTNMVLIFDVTDEEPFYVKINRYLPIQVHDDGRYPRRVCSSCYLSVTTTQVFLDRTLEGQRTICSLLKEADAATAVTGQLYPAGNELQRQLTEGGVVLQKRRPGRPRKCEQLKPKAAAKPKPADPPPVPRSRRSRGRLPARFQNSVPGPEFERVLHEVTAEAGAEDEDEGEEEALALKEGLEEEEAAAAAAADGEYKAPCHIRVDVLSLPPERTGRGRRSGDLSDDGDDDPAEAGQPADDVTTRPAGASTVDAATSRPDQAPPARLQRGRRRKLRYQCEVCAKWFFHEGRLQFHRGLHRGVRYECLSCTNRFKLSSELASHQSETGHTGQGVVEGVDDEAFVDESRVQCTECKRTFRNHLTLGVHIREKHNPDKKLSCEVCHKRFGQLGSLKLHQKYHKARQRTRLSCGECDKVCNSRTALTYHMETAHAPGRLFLCNLCGKSFRHQQLLTRHALVHSTERKFKCSECDAAFKTRGNLKNHSVRHTGEKPFSCEHCAQRFAHKTSLDLHLRWHSGEKPHECQVCKKRFTQLSNLQEHSRSHSGEKPFPCTVCSRAFTTGSQLKMHLRRHGAGRPFTCRPCGKEFSTRQRWRAHTQMHGDTRPFACTTCGRQMGDKWSLRKHMRTHAAKGPKSFTCDVCSWCFADADSLRQHRASHATADGESLEPRGELNQADSLLLDTKESQVFYVTYQNPADPTAVQFVNGIASVDGGQTSHLSADSEVLLEDAAAGVVQLAANKGLVTAEGVRTLELTTDDGRRIQITLRDDKSDLEPTELAATAAADPAAGADAMAAAPPADDVAAVAAVAADPEQAVAAEATLSEEHTAVLVTAQNGRQFRLLTPAGADPVQLATEYIASLTDAPTAQFG